MQTEVKMGFRETDKLINWMNKEVDKSRPLKAYKIGSAAFKMLDRRSKFLRREVHKSAAMITFEILLLIAWCYWGWNNIF